ncbi:hypothetical protein GS934_11240 [Rhodococcus hoagii]|nr:hypothetical protein [Prescottella equi]NKZ87744.1 hypothetical protein [Prescottella equi]
MIDGGSALFGEVPVGRLLDEKWDEFANLLSTKRAWMLRTTRSTSAGVTAGVPIARRSMTRSI